MIQFAVLLVALFGVQNLAAQPEGTLLLERVVYSRPVDQLKAPFEVFKDRRFLTPNPQQFTAIDTVWWDEEAGRMETLFMKSMSFDGQTFRAKVLHQKNEFPMDSTWDLLLAFDLKLKVNEIFSFSSRVGDREFYIEMGLYRPAAASDLVNY